MKGGAKTGSVLIYLTVAVISFSSAERGTTARKADTAMRINLNFIIMEIMFF